MKFLGYLLVRVVIAIFAIMPIWFIHLLSDGLTFIFLYVLPYRKKLVVRYLKMCFPDRSEEEIKQITKDFYRNLSDVLLESVKGFSMSGEKVSRRYHLEPNPEVDELYEEGRSFLAVTAHLTNWEWGVPATGMFFKHKVLGVYKKLSHPYINEYVKRSRTRYNVQLVEMKETIDKLRTDHGMDPFVLVLIADQRPSDPNKGFWTTFLGQETAFFYGAELLAKEHDLPVFFLNIKRVKRGKYKVEIEKLCDKPSDLPEGEIIKRYSRVLEREIRSRPADWLWSHSRWKHPRPPDMPIQD